MTIVMHTYLWREGTKAAAISLETIKRERQFLKTAQFTDCISEINNTQADNAKDLDIVMPMYNLIEYSDNYVKTVGRLCQYCRDDPNDNITDSAWFTGNTGNADTVNVEIVVPLKWLIFGQFLKYCEITLDLTWSADRVICKADRLSTFTIHGVLGGLPP